MSISALIVGGGLMGRWHARAARRAGARVVGVVDPAPGAAAALATRVGATAFETLDPGLALAPDVVHVCSPDGTHGEIARRALAAGAHVLVEKPVGSAEEVDALLSLAAERGRTLTPSHQLLFQGWTTEVSSLGPLRSIEHRVCSTGTSDDPAALAWGIAWHGLAIAQRLLGPVDWTRAGIGGELAALGTGADATVSLSVSLTGRPPRNRLTLVGTEGTLEADLFLGHHTIDRSTPSRSAKAARPFLQAARESAAAAHALGGRAARGDRAFPGLTQLTRALYQHLEGDAPAPLPPAHLRAVARAAQQLRP